MFTQLQIANLNIKLYVLIRIFAKRVFLPLSAIYFMDTAGFSVSDIALLAAFYSAVQLVAEVPTGYFADRVGRVASLRLGGLFCMIATIIFVTFHTKLAIFSGVLLEALGYSFLGGAGEAMIHDSLVIKKREDDYTKFMSRTMALSLIANAILLALVPMTYVIDPRYPFILGTLAYFVLFMVAMFMQDVERSAPSNTFSASDFSKIIGKRYILLFGLTFGIISSLYTSPVDFAFIALREYGLQAERLGWIIAGSSLVGAAMGPFIHYLRSLKLSSYVMLDLGLILMLYLGGFSGSANTFAMVVVFVVGFWRYRKIIYQNYLLSAYPTTYKATLLSTMNNLEQLNNVWLPLAIGAAIAHTTTAQGFALIGLFCLLIAPVYLYATLRFFRHTKLSDSTLVNTSPGVV